MLNGLQNGNTIVTAAAWGEIFELTPKNEVVWEYKVPTTVERGAVKMLQDGDTAQVFLAYRYGADYPGLKGKTLKPQGKITD